MDGFAEAVSGTGLAIASSWTGIGAVAGGFVAVHGADQIQAGLREFITEKPVDSVTSQGLQAAGVSQQTANRIDMGISVAGSLGSGLGTAALKVSNVAATDAAVQGMSKMEIFKAMEKGSKALNNADYIALGGETTSAVAKARMMEAGIDAAGNAYKLTTTLSENIVQSGKLILTEPTPGGNIAAGISGAGAATVAT